MTTDTTPDEGVKVPAIVLLREAFNALRMNPTSRKRIATLLESAIAEAVDARDPAGAPAKIAAASEIAWTRGYAEGAKDTARAYVDSAWVFANRSRDILRTTEAAAEAAESTVRERINGRESSAVRAGIHTARDAVRASISRGEEPR